MKKRTLFVSAMLGAMAMTTTLTSCVEDEVSSAVAADRDQHLQDKKDQAAYSNANNYKSLMLALHSNKAALLEQNYALDNAKEKLAKLESGVEPLTAYWAEQVEKAEANLAAAKKRLETLQSLKGMDGAALTEEWAKASEALDTAHKVWLEKNQARHAIEKSLNLRKAELETMPAVKWTMYSFVETPAGSGTYKKINDLEQTKFNGTEYKNLQGEIDGTATDLFKVTTLYKDSQFEPGVSTNGYTSYSKKKKPTDTDLFTFPYLLVSVQSSKIAEDIYKRYEEYQIKGLETALGKETDEASATGSLYAKLAQAKKELAEATTDLEKVNKTNAVQTAQDAVDTQIKQIKSSKKELEDLKTAVAEIAKGVPQDFYDAYLQDIVAYDKARKEDNEGQMAWEQARAVTTALTLLSANFTGDYSGATPQSIEESIAKAEKKILDCQKDLFTAKENQENLKGTNGVTALTEDYNAAIKEQQDEIERASSEIASLNAIIAVIEKQLATLATKF